jgi:hypothetical protein
VRVRPDRLWLLPALLLVLVAVTAPPMPGIGYAPPGSPVLVASVSAAPSAYDERLDRPRGGTVFAGNLPTTATPDTWWVVWQPSAPGHADRVRSSPPRFGIAPVAAAAPANWSIRAPPRVA